MTVKDPAERKTPMATLEQWITTDLVTASPEDTVFDACRRMFENHTGSVLVLEGKHLAGIFTERDVLNKVVVGEKDPKTTKVASVMTANHQTARAEDNALETYDRMRKGRFRHMPIVDAQGEVIGMLSIKDLNLLAM